MGSGEVVETELCHRLVLVAWCLSGSQIFAVDLQLDCVACCRGFCCDPGPVVCGPGWLQVLEEYPVLVVCLQSVLFAICLFHDAPWYGGYGMVWGATVGCPQVGGALRTASDVGGSGAPGVLRAIGHGERVQWVAYCLLQSVSYFFL
jgi:hypothetical protein